MALDPEPEAPPPLAAAHSQKKNTAIIVGAIALVVLLLVLLLLSISFMVSNPATTETLRDVAIILLALEGLLIGFALVVLIVQLARLTVLLENEVKPILESTNETISTLRGTTTFLSNNLADPVIRANSAASAVRRALELLRLIR
jgi:PDZ domain-containing secreted protein